MPYVAHRAMAEDVVRETWLGVLRGLDRFEARSSLKTWIGRSWSIEPGPEPSATAGGRPRSRPCRHYLDQMRKTIDVVGEIPEETVSLLGRRMLQPRSY